MSRFKYLAFTAWLLPLRILLSFIYGIVINLRNLFYDIGIFKTHRVKVHVISVGNISVGGSGKTILVQALLDYFLKRDLHPSVLSRGYGRETKGLFLVADKLKVFGVPSTAGDEPFLIASKYPGVPVVVSENRLLGAKFLVDNYQPDVIIMDDGFQHRKLYRDFDFLILDYPRLSPGHLLPWGKLREPFTNVKRADLALFSKAGLETGSSQNLELRLENHLLDADNNPVPFGEIEGDFGLFAGLGNPQFFFASIQALIGPASDMIEFPDHAKYTSQEREIIASTPCKYWVTTEKDFIKLNPAFCLDNHILYIRVSTDLPEPMIELLKQSFNF